MKRIVLSSLAVGAVIALLAACAPSADAGSGTSANRQTGVDISKIAKSSEAIALLPKEITKAGKLVIGVDPTYAPNEFKDKDGNPIGWEIDLMDAVAAKLGVTTTYRVAKFDNIVPSILGQKYDLGLGGYYDTKKRQESLDLVDFNVAGNQFASAKDNRINSELDVCGMKVAAQNGGSAPLIYLPALDKECAAAGKNPIEILGYDTQDDATAALTLGRVDAMVADSPVVGYAVRLSKGKLVTSDVYDSTLSGTPMLKNRGTFAKAIQSSLQELMDEGTYMSILKYWGVEDGAIDKIQINGAKE